MLSVNLRPPSRKAPSDHSLAHSIHTHSVFVQTSGPPSSTYSAAIAIDVAAMTNHPWSTVLANYLAGPIALSTDSSPKTTTTGSWTLAAATVTATMTKFKPKLS